MRCEVVAIGTELLLGIIVGLVVLGVRWLGASEHSPFRHAPRPVERSALGKAAR